eukprot:7743682-Alexandrium_andersonii.AAC.1
MSASLVGSEMCIRDRFDCEPLCDTLDAPLDDDYDDTQPLMDKREQTWHRPDDSAAGSLPPDDWVPPLSLLQAEGYVPKPSNSDAEEAKGMDIGE